ncbi:hypothetical protein CONPUDRAFT_59951 [Coniophora puteana RWD-64-598 SS2]|uniref:Membrane magnesium transporter n=1 Tax=Coniophora puteana (strain RWD-64-598) TaxID=741705 RepID=A0A5M3MK74_CONPW|nr:uncharacterized protein CONPUDRAFT_59951 [Coniophora puteana RWD-64-598 SS2]EIW79417.1 hypothetical protein CONPUDRAFT_59951 [Coniophora puteana RWD-64-598 SS2]
MFGRLFLVVATFALIHAAYSTYEHLSRLKALNRPEGTLPLNAVYESVFALILGILGAALNAPTLKDITWAGEMKKRTIDEMDTRLGFANYNTRARHLLYPNPKS